MRARGRVGDEEVEFEIPVEYEKFFRLTFGEISLRDDAAWCPCRPSNGACTWPSC
jgi:hypothetical protein